LNPECVIGLAARMCELRVRGTRCLLVLVAVAAGLLSSGSIAVAQQSGTVLRQTMTVLGTAAPTAEINIPGPKSINTTTKLFLEFGPDGSGVIPPPNPSLPASVNFRITSSINTNVVNFTPAGGINQAAFPNKIVALTVDSVNSPGFYVLSVTHLADIPITTTETWKLEITGLPASLRVMGSVDQGTFKSLTPIGVAAGPPGIVIAPSPITAGTSPTLAIASTSGLNLSGTTAAQVTISPGDGVSNINVSGVTASGLTLSFTLASCASAGSRTLSVRGATAAFQVTAVPNAPLITVSPSSVTAGTSPTLTVASTGCMSLAGVGSGQVNITPVTGISSLNVTNATTTQLNVSFTLASNATTGAHTLTVAGASTSFNVASPPPPPPPPTCPGGGRCCETNPAGTICTVCVTPPQQCQ
jgi:hypothetical protein